MEEKWIPSLGELIVQIAPFDLGRLEGEFTLGKVEQINQTATGLDIRVSFADYPDLPLLGYCRKQIRPATEAERATWATQRITRGFQ